MEKHIEVIEQAGQSYAGKYHCCEAIVKAIAEYQGTDPRFLLKVCTPFGGGLAGNGSVCGSLVAAYLCMGAFRGRDTESESRSSACDPVNRIYQKFLSSYRTVNCRDIVGYNKKDPAAVELYGEKVKREVCIPLTREVTRWILMELEQNE